MNTYLDKPVTSRAQLRRAFFCLSTYRTSLKTFSEFKTAVLKARARPLQRDANTLLRLLGKKISLPKFKMIVVKIDICLYC